MIAHTADCWDCESRMALVPSRDHSEGDMYEVFGLGHQYPELTSNDRAWIFRPQPGMRKAEVMGTIPEVNHTYAVWESNYAMMNEYGLTIGESSCSASIPQGPGRGIADPKTGEKGPALFSIGALIGLMLARCRTAECAVQLAGDMAYNHGFYGESWMSGEALTIADSTGDAWIFHVSADNTHTSALWAAQRVPDGHFAVVGNTFILRVIDTEDPVNFKWSENLFRVTEEMGIYDGVSPFDWSKVMGNYKDRPWYASVRIFSMLTRVAPSLELEAVENPLGYPMTVQVDTKLQAEDVMNLFRTFYEGTQFDMTKGILGGMFGMPYRLEIGGEGGSSWPDVKGQFSRGLSIPRTTYCIVGYPEPSEPILWFATDMPATGVFVPFLARTLKEASQPEVSLEETMQFYGSSYAAGIKTNFSRDSAWWAFDFVANWMGLNFHNMSYEYVYPAIQELQPKAMKAAEEGSTAAAREVQELVVKRWWELADTLIERYNDNYWNFPEANPDKVYTVGYNPEWLKMIGYDNSFIRPQYVESMKNCVHDYVNASYLENHLLETVAIGALGVAFVFSAGIFAGFRFASKRLGDDTYSALPTC